MRDLPDHPPDLRGVLLGHGRIEAPEAEGLDDPLLLVRAVNRASDLRYPQQPAHLPSPLPSQETSAFLSQFLA